MGTFAQKTKLQLFPRGIRAGLEGKKDGSRFVLVTPTLTGYLIRIPTLFRSPGIYRVSTIIGFSSTETLTLIQPIAEPTQNRKTKGTRRPRLVVGGVFLLKEVNRYCCATC